MASSGPMINEERFHAPGWQDVPWAVGFLGHLAVVTVAGLHALQSIQFTTPDQPIPVPPLSPTVLLSPVIALGLALATAIIILMALQKHPTTFIWATNGLQVAIAVLLGLILLGAGVGPGAGLALLVAAGVNAAWLFMVKGRVAFASVVLQGASGVVFRHRSTMALGFLAVILMAMYLPLWVLCLLYYGEDVHLLVFLFCLYWTWQVVQAVAHTAVSTVTATWYFMPYAAPPNPTLAALHRTLTTSFGSVCMGALSVAMVKTLRWVADLLQDHDNGFVSGCGQCLVHWVEVVVQYCNEYAYVQVAMYGKGFVEASKDTWRLMRDCGISAIINDLLISRTLLLTSVVASILIGLAAPLLSRCPGDFYVIMAPASFLVAFFVLSTSLQPVSSAVIALFVCYAEQPEALGVSNPALARDLQAAVAQQRTTLRPTDALLGAHRSGSGGGQYYTQDVTQRPPAPPAMYNPV